jgi:hypothetical protein
MPKLGPAIAILCLVRACLAGGPVSGMITPRFEENAGQSSGDVQFLVRAPGYAAAFVREGAVLYAAPSGTPDSGVIQMRLLGAASRPALGGEGDPVASTILYRGAFGSLGSRLHNYNVLRYQDVYPGIDWLWHFQEGALEFQFELDPGADPASIRMEFTGASGVRLDRDGNLDVDGGVGLHYRRPQAWQDGPAGREAVPVTFHIDLGVVTFDVGRHDSRLPLTIDPVVKYSRYLGGAGYDAAYAVATDAAGSVYVTGETSSVDFTSSSGVRYNRDAFVSKLSPDGSQTVYTVLLSSDGNDAGKAIAIDGGGNIWVAGVAGGSGFPTTSGALSSHSSGAEDAFVARLDSNGILKYSTYLGGGGTDVATALAIDSSGGIYVAGYTSSVDFPTTSGAPQTSYQGGTDAFLVKLSSSGGFLSYSTLLGGSGNDSFSGLSVDAGGTACAAGQTSSSNLPVRNAVQATYGGNGDALLACLNPTGTAWSTLTYLGGSGSDEALGIARDAAGNIYLTGDTYSYNFPTTSSAYRKVSAGGYDAFAVKLNSAGTAIVFATLLGGSASDSGTAVSVDASSNVWIAGYTASVDFPVTGSPSFGGYFDGFIAEISPDGSSLLWANYLGGSGDDRCLGMTLAATGDPIVVGLTGSANFPTTTGAIPAPYNAFVVRIAGNAPPAIVSVTPGSGTGSTQTFTTTFTDPDGYRDISVVGIEFGRQLSFVGACYMNYTSFGLWLMNDAGTAWLQPKALGSPGIIQNSQCQIDLSRSSVTGNGPTLSISLVMTFTANLGPNFQVYASVADTSGLQDSWRVLGTWGIPASPPHTTSISPSSGTGSTQTFTATFTDPDGYRDISVVGIEFGRQLSFVGTCFMNYTSFGLWLMNDAGTAWLQPKALGSPGILQNSQCAIDVSRSSATGTGTTLSISLVMSFTANLGTNFQVYASVADTGGLQDSWRIVGTWGIPASPPHTTSVSPSSGTGSTQTFTATFTDPDGYGDISVVGIEFGRQLSFVGTCYMNYTSFGLWLMNDAGTAWLPPKSPGSPGILQNSQCAIDLSRSSATGNGTTLSISLVMTFTASLGTNFQVYASVADTSGLQDSWRVVGAWVDN